MFWSISNFFSYTFPDEIYLKKSPILLEKSLVKSVKMIINVFLKTNAIHEINIGSRSIKSFMKQQSVINIISQSKDASCTQPNTSFSIQHLNIFDNLEFQVINLLKGPFARFIQTKEFEKFRKNFSKQQRKKHRNYDRISSVGSESEEPLFRNKLNSDTGEQL